MKGKKEEKKLKKLCDFLHYKKYLKISKKQKMHEKFNLMFKNHNKSEYY